MENTRWYVDNLVQTTFERARNHPAGKYQGGNNLQYFYEMSLNGYIISPP